MADITSSSVSILTDGRGPLLNSEGMAFNPDKMTDHMRALMTRLCDDFGVRPADVMGRCRGAVQIARARQVFTWLLMEYFDIEPKDVGDITGRARTSAERGADVIDRYLDKHPSLEAYMQRLFDETNPDKTVKAPGEELI